MHQHEVIEFRRIRNVPEIINVTFDFIRQNFRLFWRSLLFIAFPPLVAGLTIFSYFFVAMIDSFAVENGLGEMVVSFLWASALSILLCGIGTTMLVAVVHVFVQLFQQKGPDGFTVQDVWSGVRKTFWMLFWTIVGLEVAYCTISLLAIIVPLGQFGLLVGVSFSALYFPLRIYERRGFIQSIIVSSELIAGRWWATFGMLWLFLFFNFGLMEIFVVPIAVLSWAGETHLVHFEELARAGSLVRMLGSVLLSAYMTGLFLVYSIPLLSLIFHYHSQRERKGAPALLEEVEKIGMAESAV